MRKKKKSVIGCKLFVGDTPWEDIEESERQRLREHYNQIWAKVRFDRVCSMYGEYIPEEKIAQCIYESFGYDFREKNPLKIKG